MKYWIVSSKHSRDGATAEWSSKWTADNFLRMRRFTPSKRGYDFAPGDKCILKVFGGMEFIGDFRISSEGKKDSEGDHYYEIDEINEWDFPIHQHTLPIKYTNLLSRSPSTDVPEQTYFELLGIRNFTQNLKLNYKNRLHIGVSEAEVENLLDAKNALRSIGLEIVERQKEYSVGNKIDMLCKDSKGDLVVVELKKHGPNETIGQLARYVTDVREHVAKPSQKVRGLILAFDVEEQLIKAARGVDFEVMLYQIGIQ